MHNEKRKVARREFHSMPPLQVVGDQSDPAFAASSSSTKKSVAYATPRIECLGTEETVQSNPGVTDSQALDGPRADMHPTTPIADKYSRDYDTEEYGGSNSSPRDVNNYMGSIKRESDGDTRESDGQERAAYSYSRAYPKTIPRNKNNGTQLDMSRAATLRRINGMGTDSNDNSEDSSGTTDSFKINAEFGLSTVNISSESDCKDEIPSSMEKFNTADESGNNYWKKLSSMKSLGRNKPVVHHVYSNQAVTNRSEFELRELGMHNQDTNDRSKLPSYADTDEPDLVIFSMEKEEDEVNGDETFHPVGFKPRMYDDSRIKTRSNTYGRRVIAKAAIIVFVIMFVASLCCNVFQAIIPPKDEWVQRMFNSPPATWKPYDLQSQAPSTNTDKRISYATDPEVLAVSNNPALHRVFYGINYTPKNAQYPQCGANLKEVTKDIAILSQLTTRLRMYGTDCNQVDLVFTAIQDLDVDMTVSVGIWVDRFVENTLRQLVGLKRILKTFPPHYINSILVGNEALFRDDVTDKELIGYIEFTREFLERNGLGGIPVGTSDIGVQWTNTLSDHVDVLAANVHPFFGGVPVNLSTKWTYDYMLNDVINTRSSRVQQYVISEVGWPTDGGALHEAEAGVAQLQHFIDTWICANQGTHIGWFWFEAFDQPWKEGSSSGSWEPYWGLFTDDRELKNITIPLCKSM